jgi:hypothetical protein
VAVLFFTNSASPVFFYLLSTSLRIVRILSSVESSFEAGMAALSTELAGVIKRFGLD